VQRMGATADAGLDGAAALRILGGCPATRLPLALHDDEEFCRLQWGGCREVRRDPANRPTPRGSRVWQPGP